MRKDLARCVGVTIAALSLAACSRDPLVTTSGAVPTGNWRVERQMDRVTGAPLASAFLVTQTVSNPSELFPKPATLQILCFRNQPTVRISFEFKIGSTRNSMLGYRFDEKPGREVAARFLQDYTTAVIEDQPSVAQFIGELASSNVLYVRIRSLNAGRSSAEFNLDGAPAAIDAALAGCRVPPRQAPAAMPEQAAVQPALAAPSD